MYIYLPFITYESLIVVIAVFSFVFFFVNEMLAGDCFV